MATAAQLHAEVWWGREITTDELDWLADTLCERTGQPRTAAGTKGNEVHLRGGHRSQEWIKKSAYCTNRTYTTQAGLTETQARHIAALDFTPGSPELMIAQCKRLMAAMKAGELDEVVELYGNVDGDQIVDGWDNIRDRAATSDSSHLWHWHLTFDRRYLTNRALMERILAIVMGDDMPTLQEFWATDGLVPAPRPPYANSDYGDPDKPKDGNKTWGAGNALRAAIESARQANATAAKVGVQVQALTAVVQTLASRGTSVDTAAVIAAVDRVGAELAERLAETERERDELRVALAAALDPAA